MNDTIRKAAVSGRFYPSRREEIISLIGELEKQAVSLNEIAEEKILLGAVVPHAGYIYSARHAIPFFRLLARRKPAPETIIVVCPNHYGERPDVALDANEWWETPLGKVQVDRDFYDFLDIPVSSQAHKREHAAEVMLPLLQHYLNHPFSILPVSIKEQTPPMAVSLAKMLHQACLALQKEVVVIASSDFSHFVSPEGGQRRDDMVLERILARDTTGVYDVVQQHRVSVCGYGPVMTLMEMGSLALAHPELKIISRGHSGEVSPSGQVVHYITIVLLGDEKNQK
ncbi:MAG: AmmeMemoRadiSam system protein B [Bacteroidota bacterium]